MLTTAPLKLNPGYALGRGATCHTLLPLWLLWSIAENILAPIIPPPPTTDTNRPPCYRGIPITDKLATNYPQTIMPMSQCHILNAMKTLGQARPKQNSFFRLPPCSAKCGSSEISFYLWSQKTILVPPWLSYFYAGTFQMKGNKIPVVFEKYEVKPSTVWRFVVPYLDSYSLSDMDIVHEDGERIPTQRTRHSNIIIYAYPSPPLSYSHPSTLGLMPRPLSPLSLLSFTPRFLFLFCWSSFFFSLSFLFLSLSFPPFSFFPTAAQFYRQYPVWWGEGGGGGRTPHTF